MWECEYCGLSEKGVKWRWGLNAEKWWAGILKYH